MSGLWFAARRRFPASLRKRIKNGWRNRCAICNAICNNVYHAGSPTEKRPIGRPDPESAAAILAIGVGFSYVDRQMRKEMGHSRALTEALSRTEEANAAKTAFLSSMSHEIRTSMNAIIGLDMIALHDPNISQTTRDELKKAHMSKPVDIDRLTEMLGRMLAAR